MLADVPTGHVVWVHAPGGMGKTTFVSQYTEKNVRQCHWYRLGSSDDDLASFLHDFSTLVADEVKGARTHLGANQSRDPAALAARFFHEVFAAMSPNTWVVLDEAQKLAERPTLSATLAGAANALPAHLTLVYISRDPPPPWAARMQLARTWTQLGPEQWRLTNAETSAMLASLLGRAPTDSHASKLCELTQGWAAAVVLLAALPSDQLGPAPMASPSTSALFDYLDQEFFGRLNDAEQQLLVSTSILPSVTPHIASLLSGNKHAAKLLQALCTKNVLVQRTVDGTFRFHAILRTFLSSKRPTAPYSTRIARLLTCAEYVEKSGDIAAAATLLELAQDEKALARLIRSHAGEMITQGQWRNARELVLTYQRLGAAIFDPWVSYWLGVCELNTNTQTAREHFTYSYKKFREPRTGDRAGAYLSWSRIVESLFLESGDFSQLDSWIDEYRDTRAQLGPSLSKEVLGRVTLSMFNALVFRRPGDDKLRGLERRLLVFLRITPNHDVRVMLASYLMRYYLYRGDLASASAVAGRIHSQVRGASVSPLVYSAWLTIYSAFVWFARSPEAGIEAVEASLSEIQGSGIQLFAFTTLTQGVYAAMALGDVARARDYLARIDKTLRPERRLDMGQYLFLVGWLALIDGDTTTALGNMSEALEVAKQTESPYVLGRAHNSLAQVHLVRENYEAAEQSLHLATEQIEMGGFRSIQYRIDLSKAQLAIAQDDWARCDVHLRRAFATGRAEGYQNLPLWDPKILGTLCMRSLHRKIEVDFVERVIRMQHLEPPPSATQHWPWPVRILTLGGFVLEVGGTKFDSIDKRVQRPLQLLKCLIAMGENGVSSSSICAALWPESEGDKAAASLKVNLNRLRQLLPRDAIRLVRGTLSLNRDIVWTDTNALAKLLEERPPDSIQLGEIYRGPFLPEEDELSWASPMRTSLESRIESTRHPTEH